jgi:hypothetical protein
MTDLATVSAGALQATDDPEAAEYTRLAEVDDDNVILQKFGVA